MGSIRAVLNTPAAPALSTAWSIGLDHHDTARLSNPATAMVPTPVMATLVASHLDRLTLWFQMSLCVPDSNSRAISGAPQNAPMSAGTR